MVSDFIPAKDASLGLIYRFNNLWVRADSESLAGRYDKWDWVLDVIYRNLQYRNPLVKVIDENGKVSYKIPKKDFKVYTSITNNISELRTQYEFARKKSDRRRAHSEWYQALQVKDMWLRKMMMELRLYLKETAKSPGTSMYGGNEK